MNRRAFLSAAGAAAGLTAAQLEVRVHAKREAAPIPAEFGGLGFEVSTVAAGNVLSARNKAYVQLVRTISRRGVIRVGGNTVDFSIWSPSGAALALPKGTVVNRASIDVLSGFLRAIGWDLIWTLNTGTGTPESAADQAAAVADSAGDRLLCFELGNEPDLFVQAGHRQPGYGYEQYRAEFARFAEVLRRRVPAAPLAGPAVIGATDWVASFSRDFSNARLLTEHYYLSVAADPAATIRNLLTLDPRFMRVVTQLRSISRSSGIPYRMAELNSFAGGGKPGVSDTFAATLWALDLMFTLASANGQGINWETGVNHLGFVSSYSPIFTDEQGAPSVQPLYYAMLAFRQALGGKLLYVNYDAAGVNARVHAFRSASGRLWVAIINKDLSATASLRILIDEAVTGAELWPLAALTVESRTGITFGGAEVSPQGIWSPSRRDRQPVHERQLFIAVPPASAQLIAFS